MSITMESQAIIRTHKGTGIASFVTGVTSVILFLALIGTAAVMAKAGKMTPEFTIMLGMGVFAIGFVDLVGIGLGLASALDRASKKTYPALGLALNIGIPVLFAVLAVIGSMKGH